MKRTIFLLLSTMLLAMLQAFPKDTEGKLSISGRVTDADGKPLAGAYVVVENTKLGTSTGRDGTYMLTLRKGGFYRLTASFLGFATEATEVEVMGDATINFTLSLESYLAEEVVVSATRASSKMPIAQTTLGAEQIAELKKGFDIPYLLELLPSVVTTSEGGTGVGNTSFCIRGTDMSRINVTVNGIPLNDPESQAVFWVNMPDFANSVDNVQVQRGVGTSTQGAGAFGATVNFQTITLNPVPFASAEALAGSFNTYQTSMRAGTGMIKDMFSFETRYSKILSDGYMDRGWSDHQSLFFTGARHTAKSLLRFNIIHGTQHTGITWEGTPGYLLEDDRRYNPAGYMGTDENEMPKFYPNESDNYRQTHYQLLYSYQISQNLSFNLSGFWVDGRGFYEQYKRKRKLAEFGIDPIIMGDDTIKRVDMVRQKWLDNNFFGFTTSFAVKSGDFSTTLGGGWNRYDNDHFGNVIWTSMNAGIPKDYEWYRHNGTKEDLSVFAKTTYEATERLSFFGDVQYRIINYSMAGNDDDLLPLDQTHRWAFFNPKAGMLWSIAPTQDAFVSVGVGHREPTRSDIKDAMKHGTNQTPKYEQLVDYELGYSLKSQHCGLGITLYYMDYIDQLTLTGKLSESGYPLMVNVKSSYRAGIEVVGGVIPAKWIRWDANLTLSKNIIKDFIEYVDLYNSDWELIGQQENHLGDTPISFSPPVVGSSIIRVEPWKNTSVSLITKYVGAQYIDNTGSTDRKLDAYLVNNLKLEYRTAMKGTKDVSFQLMVNNLFNEQYVSNGWVYRAVFDDGSPEYREDGFFPQAGVNFMGRILVEF